MRIRSSTVSSVSLLVLAFFFYLEFHVVQCNGVSLGIASMEVHCGSHAQGGYEDLKRVGNDNYYHIFIPYMFSEKDLIPFLRSNLDHFKQIYDSANDLKRIS